MKLSKNSFHYKLNNFVFGKWFGVERNLCPYFWKTVFACLFFPIAIFGWLASKLDDTLGTGLTSYESKDFEVDKTTFEIIYFTKRVQLPFIISGIVSIILMLVLIIMIGFFTTSFVNGLIFIGALLLVSGIALLPFWLPMLVAKLEGVCPSIEWDE